MDNNEYLRLKEIVNAALVKYKPNPDVEDMPDDQRRAVFANIASGGGGGGKRPSKGLRYAKGGKKKAAEAKKISDEIDEVEKLFRTGHTRELAKRGIRDKNDLDKYIKRKRDEMTEVQRGMLADIGGGPF